MSLGCASNYLGQRFPQLIEALQNGKCRLLAKSAGLDANGFDSGTRTARTSDFLPCIWNPKSRDKTDAEEVIVAAQTRGRFVYEIKFAQFFNSLPVICEPQDILEIKLNLNTSAVRELEILTVTNESNIAWVVYAVDIRFEHQLDETTGVISEDPIPVH